jgi:hypothetical protein
MINLVIEPFSNRLTTGFRMKRYLLLFQNILIMNKRLNAPFVTVNFLIIDEAIKK